MQQTFDYVSEFKEPYLLFCTSDRSKKDKHNASLSFIMCSDVSQARFLCHHLDNVARSGNELDISSIAEKLIFVIIENKTSA